MRQMTLWLMVAVVVPLQGLRAQSTPFLSDDDIRILANEISGDRAFEHIRVLTRWHRDSGMEGYFKAAEYVVETAKAAGLEDVRFVEQVLPRPNYTPRSAELWIVEPFQLKLADMGDHALVLADGSHSADVTAEVIWIGDATKETLKDLDVSGKIVLTDRSAFLAAYNAVWEKGAVGVITYQTSEGKNPMDFPDQIGWSRVPVTPPEGKEGTFAFVLSPRKGDNLKTLLHTSDLQDIFAIGKKTPGGKVTVRAKVETEIGSAPGRTGFVEGWIRGTTYKDQQIVVTAHLQEEQGSANDDGSGCGNLLELARVYMKLINEGKMPRPLRDIRFWWTDEIYSEYRYFQDHPDEPKKFLANIHQDMTGANQALGHRVQHLILAPHSRTSYLDAMFESIGTYVIRGNNAYLSASRQGGLPRPHTRPIYSLRGSRQPFRAEFVPHFGSSDHICFLDGPINTPAVALINWDDDYIHSSDDDLWQIDQTQLQRNNFIIGALGHVLAFAEARHVPLIAGETFSQGSKRLANDLQVALNLIRSPEGSPEEGWKDATMVIGQGINREIRALNSSRVFAGTDRRALKTIDDFVSQMREKENELTGNLRIFHRQVHGADPKTPPVTAAERAASRKIPVNNPSLSDYFSNRSRIRFQTKLHGLMRAEVFNFVDGTKSYLDIYKAVKAEALAAGSWYYGTVTLEDVVGLLDAAVEAKALSLK